MFPFGNNPQEQVLVRFHVSQLARIKEALAKDPTYDEKEHLLIGMIEDAIPGGEVENCFCY